jgi:hypothetical protein
MPDPRRSDHLSRAQVADIAVAAAQRRRAAKNEQELFVVVVKVQWGDDCPGLQLIEIGRQSLGARVPCESCRAQDGAVGVDLSVPQRV